LGGSTEWWTHPIYQYVQRARRVFAVDYPTDAARYSTGDAPG
jgi:hypothetical protein